MTTEIRMPRLTDAMTEGAVVSWRKREGEVVRAGEVIAEIEADKTTVDLESPGDGTLARIVAPAGAGGVKAGDVLAVLDPRSEPSEPAAPQASIAGAVSTMPEGVREPVPPPPQLEAGVSPLARRMAGQAGLDLAALLGRGSGPRGRVVKADVLAALGFGPDRDAPEPSSPVSLGGAPPFDEVPHSSMRQVIARRLGESKRTVPHFYLEVYCEVDALLRLRAELQASGGVGDGVRLSINDFILRAAALALRKTPEANACWTESATRRYRRVDLAVAVATESGLVAPVIREADRKGLAELSAELRDLAARARAGRLRPEEYQEGTFTVSNLGMYGVDASYAIINPPQAGILGVGAARPRPVARDGVVTIGTVMTCTLSADHRVLDGATGARLLAAFKALIEQPTTMLL
jgi:pyruvate dehydrogenase E2 component (dihydrolipoamide acetyltransferase)